GSAPSKRGKAPLPHLFVFALHPLNASISASASNSSSIHPSTGKASTGKWFCHKLKRRRSRVVRTSELFGPRTLSISGGAASSQVRGRQNSKFRTSATRASLESLESAKALSSP